MSKILFVLSMALGLCLVSVAARANDKISPVCDEQLQQITAIKFTHLAPLALDKLQMLIATERELPIKIFVDDDSPTKVAVHGEFQIKHSILLFIPLFPLSAGIRYQVIVANNDLGIKATTKLLYLQTKEDKKPIRVTEIYPTTNVIPENILKFYIYFSAPMREGDMLSHIHLYDQQGNDLKGVFFDNQYELWSICRKRLTLLVDPGRVKSGLSANVKQGRAFQPGQKYRLVIDKNWEAVRGTSLVADFVKEFTATREDFSAPDFHRVRILHSPRKNSLDRLAVIFPETMDHASLIQFSEVTKERKTVAGTYDVQRQEIILTFAPTMPWAKGQYEIQFDSRIEDIAANNFQGKFDRPGRETLKHQKILAIPFIIR